MNVSGKWVMVALMAIAILLPNCPCKLLELLGIEVFETADPLKLGRTTTEIVQHKGSTFLLDCHCDDKEPAFNGPSNGLQESIFTTYVEAGCLWSIEDIFYSPKAYPNSRLRAPPGNLIREIKTPSRTVLCSYLI